MSENKKGNILDTDEALTPVPLDQRTHWLTPAVIFGGLEFTIPVLMVGATLIGGFSLVNVVWLLVIALGIQWVGNSLAGFMGAKTGRASSVIARSSFGSQQARFIIGIMIFIVSMGWWAIQTAVAGEAISTMVGIDYETQLIPWAVITVIIGLIFALPSIIGYTTMKWTDYIAVPAGLLLVIVALSFSFREIGFSNIISWKPDPTMTFTAAISLIIGVNVAQWLIASDYTRYAKPKIKDNILIPLGIVAVGFPLFLVGAIMSVGHGEPDIVNVMVSLGLPFWGFLILWLATWTSQLVNNYSMGLALSNVMNVNSGRGRAFLTFLGTLIAIILALGGILNYFEEFLNFTAIIYAAAVGIMFTDFYIMRKQQWANNSGWNWMATLSLVLGILVGGYTEYINRMGLPAIHAILVAGIVYIIAMKLKAKLSPDQFTKNIPDSENKSELKETP